MPRNNREGQVFWKAISIRAIGRSGTAGAPQSADVIRSNQGPKRAVDLGCRMFVNTFCIHSRHSDIGAEFADALNKVENAGKLGDRAIGYSTFFPAEKLNEFGVLDMNGSLPMAVILASFSNQSEKNIGFV